MEIIRKVEFLLIIICLILSVFLLIENYQQTGFIILNDEKTIYPFNFINEESIKSFNDKIVLDIGNYSLERYSFSESMAPTFGPNSTGVGIIPKSEEEVHIGDIVTFRIEGEFISHRVVEKGLDEKGIYFITKGDNNKVIDEKIYFREIESVLVAIIY